MAQQGFPDAIPHVSMRDQMITIAGAAVEAALVDFLRASASGAAPFTGVIARTNGAIPSSIVRVTSADAVAIAVDSLIAAGFGEHRPYRPPESSHWTARDWEMFLLGKQSVG